MDLVLDLLATVSRWSRSNLSEISLALVGCLLVLFGADIKGWVEARLGSIAGALRFGLGALFGFGEPRFEVVGETFEALNQRVRAR